MLFFNNQLFLRWRPFYPPLADVPAQISEFLRESTHLRIAAKEIITFNASNGRVPACRSGRSQLLNSHATIRDLMCMGSYSNAVFASVHFESTGGTSYSAIALRSSAFTYTPTSCKYFHSCSRAWRTSDHGNALPVMSTMHWSHRFSSPAVASNACPSRQCLARDQFAQ